MREHEQLDGVPYSLWVDSGLVTATEGGVIDYSRIYADITRGIVPRFPLLKQSTFGYDPAFATDLATPAARPAGLKVAEVLQNYSHLSEPSQVFEALVKAGRVAHGGHRVCAITSRTWRSKPTTRGGFGRCARRNPASASTASWPRSWR